MTSSSFNLVCYTVILWGEALRDDTKNGCVADYIQPGTLLLLFRFLVSSQLYTVAQ